MKITAQITKEIEVTAMASRRKSAIGKTTVSGVEDTDGALIRCASVDCWMPIIELDTAARGIGQVTTADIHYKVCDAGEYELLDGNGCSREVGLRA